MKSTKNGLFYKLILPFIIIILLSNLINILFIGKIINIPYNTETDLTMSSLKIKEMLIKFFLVLSFVSTFLIIFVYSYFIRRHIIKPIYKIISAMRNIGAGNTEFQIPIDRTDELGELQSQFGNMMNNLNNLNNELESIREKNYQLEKFQILSNLSSGISHEINNPVNNISLMLEVLGKYQGGNEKISEIKNKIDAELSKISDITKKFSEFSRISFQDKEEISVETIINEIVQMLEFSFRTKKFDFECINNIKSEKIKIFKEPIKFIMINLIKNAIESIKDVSGKIVVIFSQSSKTYSFEVIDNGAGIDESEIKKIFAPFYTSKNNGSGLGLAISKKMADICNGVISVENNKTSGGAKFTVEFPI
ncbi:MAG TPA: HAMP domain-containing sensor histidine kinase [bacterium]|nr:HAMP domain-containing sensor histidine kinase [bacterium]